MAGSGRRAMAIGLVGVIGCGLAGCVSTQEKNARARLVAERTLAGRRPLRVVERSSDVRVLRTSLVRGRGRASAIVVELRNRGEEPLTDVPVAVGLRGRDGRRTPLNGGRGLDWFQTHVPAIGGGERVAWVFLTRRPVAAGRPYAIAGASAGAVTSEASGALPQIAAAVTARGRAVRVALDNRSDIPQYGLQVYAIARDAAGRPVAAGKATVRHLPTHGRASARVALAGAPGRHAVRVRALPTIFE